MQLFFWDRSLINCAYSSLQAECAEADVAVLSGNKHVTSLLRLKADRRFPMTIGGIDCRLIKYKVFSHLTGPVNASCDN